MARHGSNPTPHDCGDCGIPFGSALGLMLHACTPVLDQALVEPLLPAVPAGGHLTRAEISALAVVSASALQAGVLSVAARHGDRPSLVAVEESARLARLEQLLSRV